MGHETMTVDGDYTRANRDLASGHPLLQERWSHLLEALTALGFNMMVIEVYRSDLRQRWLYGAGRTAGELAEKGISAHFARPGERRVTNAWNAHTSAHGWAEHGIPAAAALDVVPLGPDGKPFTRDDEWDRLIFTIAAIGPAHGLVHFKTRGKVVDTPHLQLYPEWSDAEHRLVVPLTA